MSLIRTLVAGTVLVALLIVVLSGATLLAYLKSVGPTLPDLDPVRSWVPSEGTTILAADGSIIGVHARERRDFVPLAEIPHLVVKAFLAAEDGNYWKHSGVDPVAIARAALSNFRSKQSGQGGSTITQQVVKNLILGDERTLDRKIREAILALRADEEIGKERVLEIYLNEIYLGGGAYGVAEAARTYFGKSLQELMPHEAALIAGLPKAPGSSNPYRDPARATERRNYVIERMRNEGFLTDDDATRSMAMPLGVVRAVASSVGTNPAFLYPEEEVRRRLVSRLGRETFYSRGGTVGTTIRSELQIPVHKALRSGLVMEDRRRGWRGPITRGITFPVDWSDPRLALPKGAEDWQVAVVIANAPGVRVATQSGELPIDSKSMAWMGGRTAVRPGDVVLVADLGSGSEIVQIPDVQGAAVLMDPTTGDVLALAGGFSAELSEFNRATQARRQTGSVFKSFVYLAALEMGYDATSPVLDAPIAINQGPGQEEWRPQDSTGSGLGLITMRRSLEQSRNMSTVRLLYDVGSDAVRSLSDRVGFHVPQRMSYAMALGASEATPLDVASAYSAIANGGRKVKARIVADDPIDISQDQSVDAIAVAQVTSILRGVVTHGTGRRAFDGFSHPLAAKTGTTNGSRDAWFVAYGPRFVLAVWVGNDDFSPLVKGAAGGSTAAPIARRILDTAPGIEFAPFILPDAAHEVRADRESGQPREDGDVIEIMRAPHNLPDEIPVNENVSPEVQEVDEYPDNQPDSGMYMQFPSISSVLIEQME